MQDTSAGVGYQSGDGGTVTQLTNKTTAVTLNKLVGQITMNNAALGAGASAAFILNNSMLGGTDLLVVNCNFAGGNYEAKVRNVGGGAAAIVVTNMSGGSLSEAVTVLFAVIRGATA